MQVCEHTLHEVEKNLQVFANLCFLTETQRSIKPKNLLEKIKSNRFFGFSAAVKNVYKIFASIWYGTLSLKISF